jgi:hypothetical protein
LFSSACATQDYAAQRMLSTPVAGVVSSSWEADTAPRPLLHSESHARDLSEIVRNTTKMNTTATAYWDSRFRLDLFEIASSEKELQVLSQAYCECMETSDPQMCHETFREQEERYALFEGYLSTTSQAGQFLDAFQACQKGTEPVI